MGEDDENKENEKNGKNEENEEKNDIVQQNEDENQEKSKTESFDDDNNSIDPSDDNDGNTKMIIPWDRWLKEQEIPESLISALSSGGISSWDELHAIEGDIDEVAKELNLTTIHKIKLKALLRKLPSMSELP